MSPDQSLSLARHWSLGEDETTYFLLLIGKEKAGTAALTEWYLAQIRALVENRSHLATRFRESAPFAKESQARYYSSWEYGAVHILTSIPKFSDASEIAGALALSTDRVERLLDELLELQLVERDGNGRWKISNAHIHLPAGAPWIRAHHMNWRLRVHEHAARGDRDDLRFTGVHSVSRDDYSRIRGLLVEALERVKEIERPSKEEALVAINLDCVMLAR